MRDSQGLRTIASWNLEMAVLFGRGWRSYFCQGPHSACVACTIEPLHRHQPRSSHRLGRSFCGKQAGPPRIGLHLPTADLLRSAAALAIHRLRLRGLSLPS
jgi:hypothetical protein